MRRKPRRIRRSQLFWLAIYIVALVAIGFISLSMLGLILIFGSFLTICIVMDGSEENHIWIYLMPITWAFFIFGSILYCIVNGYEYTIGRFNKWLDRDKSDKIHA